jgi:cytochrome c oxidase cbb3-type subunit 4
MFNHYFENIIGVDIYPIISMFIFLGLFVFTIIKVVSLNKNYINKMRELPLETNKNEIHYEN